jgi:hypothetical protein
VWRSERRYRGLPPTFIGRGPKQTRTFATDTGRLGDRQALGCRPCLENRVRLCAEALPLKSVIFYSESSTDAKPINSATQWHGRGLHYFVARPSRALRCMAVTRFLSLRAR